MAARLLLLLLAGAVWGLPQSRSRLCAGCHREIWDSYRRTGMGRSFARPFPENTPVPGSSFYHAPSESYFTMPVRGGEYFQRRHQLDPAGREINVMEKRVDYVMGSGNHARAYLHRTAADTLVELPLGWYAEQGGYWAMNPGYDRPDHDGFRRPITYECMFCHNAYPRISSADEKPLAEPVYPAELPEGIDCERCHGSGARHIELASRPGAAPDLVRRAIVNPARLSADRQMEICMACHLESTSFPLPGALQRYGRGPFSFRPGEPLADFLLNFDHSPDAGRQDKFEIVSAAYRLRKSACFIQSAGKLLCTTCHNPHGAPRGEEAIRHYSAVCRQCHGGPLSTASHAGNRDCTSCHMPKRRTEDVIHVAVTDHNMQRRMPAGDLLAERAERRDAYRGEVVLYYPPALPPTPENELYQAVAQVKQQSNLKNGIARLEAAINKHAPRRAAWYLELAEALVQDGQPAKSVEWYREAVRRDAASAAVWQKLGTALRRSGQHAEAVPALRRSLDLASRRALSWHELGLTYQSLGRTPEALAALRKAVELDRDFAEAHSNLGIVQLATGDAAGAEASFREAIRIHPSYADARGNLANLLSADGREAEALTEFDRALRFRPNDPRARYNYAMLLGKMGRYGDAQRELELSLRADPGFADAHELLGDLLLGRNQPQQAASRYRDALRLRPESGRANLGLGMALAGAGDRAGAIPHLRKAAAGLDEQIRRRALEVLRQFGDGATP
ncbi:MAG: tetratricopeptide repeat protein [Acidimicrobiia bacterium]|nr:tetratricopeptide repeat protein [Acidimicrobiia bacterium]